MSKKIKEPVTVEVVVDAKEAVRNRQAVLLGLLQTLKDEGCNSISDIENKLAQVNKEL